VTVTLQEISAQGLFHHVRSVNIYEITQFILDLTQCRYKYSNRATASYVTNIILGRKRFEKMAAIIYSLCSLVSV